jgi:RES domain
VGRALSPPHRHGSLALRDPAPDRGRAVESLRALTETDLTADDLTRCQALGDAARAAGFEGILAPSAALAGEIILAVFPAAIAKVTEEHSRVQRPPARLRALVSGIRRRATSPNDAHT